MDDKIQKLLKQAAEQAKSADAPISSITSASRELAETAETEILFARLRRKLVRIREWNAESNISGFELFDADGKPCARHEAAVGDFVRVTLAGSGKNDWVKITDICDAKTAAVVTLRPSRDPTVSPTGEKTVSHFFTDASTNNFCLEKDGKKISFYVIGLDEKTNTTETANFLETIRNFAASNVGYFLGVQKSEWKIFCANFLEIEEK